MSALGSDHIHSPYLNCVKLCFLAYAQRLVSLRGYYCSVFDSSLWT